MNKTNFLTIITIFLTLTSFGQNEVMISNQNGFEVSYKAQKLSEGSKDKWLVTVMAINKTDVPLYYGVPTMKQNDGSITVNAFANQFSSKVTVRNATGFLASDGVKIKGENSNIFTENKSSLLYQYEPARIYNYENTINIKHGDTPIVTISHIYPLKKISDLNIETSATLIDGDYKNSCGAMTFSIALQEQNGKSFLMQSINGKQIKWIKTSATQFIKENDSNTTLSYNKSKKTFSFSSSDGISCEWNKL